MSYVKCFNKKTGVTYIYEAHNYWDKVNKTCKSVRHLIGKLDPETGELVPTGKRGRPRKNAGDYAFIVPEHFSSSIQAETDAKIREKDEIIKDLKEEIWRLREENRKLTGTITHIVQIANGINSATQ